MNKNFLIFILFLFNLPLLYSQSITDDLDSSDDESFEDSSLTSEKIQKISGSKRIFIITNNSSSFARGDFISLVQENQLVTRGLVAKLTNGLAGVKVVKVYNVNLWKGLKKDLTVQVIRGDDSSFKTKKGNNGESDEETSLIKDEEDLFNETTLLEEDSININDNSKRIIKTDNIVSVGLGRIPGRDLNGESQSYTQFNINWMYQIKDDFWVEGIFGRSEAVDFPNGGLNTILTNIVLRAKYTLKVPFDSYIQPYIGFQNIGASSDGAGVQGDSGLGAAELARELELLEEIQKSEIVFGVTVLKRLVPGWFGRLDLGTDVVSIGFGLEF